MRFIKQFISNKIKQEAKYLLLNILKIPYSRSALPLEILKWLPNNKPITFFDIGANTGNFSESIRGEYQVEKGILVEPTPGLIPVLEKRFADRLVYKIINAAVSDDNGQTDFYLNNDFDVVSSLLKIRNNGDELKHLNIKTPVATKIKAFTLNSICNEQQLKSVDLIKIDVQGAEHMVLKGGLETLKKTRLVFTEFSYRPLYEQSSTFFDLYKIFTDNNFMLINMGNGYTSLNGELLQGDALFINKNMVN